MDIVRELPSLPAKPDVLPSDAGVLRIRNRRYRPWLEITGILLFVLFLFAESALFWSGLESKYILRCMFLAALGMAAYGAFVFSVVWDLQEGPVTEPGLTARAVVEWLFLGMRRKELGAAARRTVLIVMRGLLPSRIPLADLKLGEGLEVIPSVRFPPQAIARVRFAPDPAEDYADSDQQMRLCQANVEINTGKRFQLILDQTDAQKLRGWAISKEIAVCDCDGYVPRTPEPNCEG